ncbi:Chromate transporter, partial [Hymenobacter roseosalivarius DSM 11622]
MHRDLVAGHGWISEADYREGMALAQLAPGPLAAQLAIYLGYVHYRLVGATPVGLVFVLPSLVMVLLLNMAYVAYDGLPGMQAVFYGVGVGVLAAKAVSSNCPVGCRSKLPERIYGSARFCWGQKFG